MLKSSSHMLSNACRLLPFCLMVPLAAYASRIDKHIYEAGSDDFRATAVDKEELRPLALAVRTFSARAHPMPARPIWRSSKISIGTLLGHVKTKDSLRGLRQGA